MNTVPPAAPRNESRPEAINIFQMYLGNNRRFGFFVHRNSWRPDRYAKVTAIDGVEEGAVIAGEPPYFTRQYPADHDKAGKTWKRLVRLESSWLDGGVYLTDCGGTYAWTQVYPNE